MTLDDILRELRSYRYPVATEAALHEAVATVLAGASVPFQREIVISRADRLDIYLPDHRAAIEVKVAGSPAQVTRQLYRYAADARIDTLVLLTTRTTHLRVPREISGTTVHVVLVGGHWL